MFLLVPDFYNIAMSLNSRCFCFVKFVLVEKLRKFKILQSFRGDSRAPLVYKYEKTYKRCFQSHFLIPVVVSKYAMFSGGCVVNF